jgi:hypothetical protein
LESADSLDWALGGLKNEIDSHLLIRNLTPSCLFADMQHIFCSFEFFAVTLILLFLNTKNNLLTINTRISNVPQKLHWKKITTIIIVKILAVSFQFFEKIKRVKESFLDKFLFF